MNEQLTLDTIGAISEKLARSGLMGTKTSPEAVFGLMLLCQSEGLTPISALKRYHIIEGKPSMRADAMLAEFIADGGRVIFHVRDDAMVGATFLSKSVQKEDAECVDRASQRFLAVWKLMVTPEGADKASQYTALAKLSRPGEETIVRTYADCEAKGLTIGNDGNTKTNWAKSPRQMLTARVITEGVRLAAPQLVTGVYTPEEIQDESLLSGLKTAEVKHASASELRAVALEEKDPEKKRQLLGAASDAAHAQEQPATLVLESDDIPMGDTKPVAAANPAPEAEPEAARRSRMNWKDYPVSELKSKSMNGRKLGELQKAEIEILYRTRCAPFIKSDNDLLRIEAEKIRDAYESFAP